MLRSRVLALLAVVIAAVGGAGIAAAATTPSRTVLYGSGIAQVKVVNGVDSATVTLQQDVWKRIPGMFIAAYTPPGQKSIFLPAFRGAAPEMVDPPNSAFHNVEYRFTWNGVPATAYRGLGKVTQEPGEVLGAYGPVGPGDHVLQLEARWIVYEEGSECSDWSTDCPPTLDVAVTGPWQFVVERVPTN